MIHLEVLSSSDPLAVGLYEFEFDYVQIGRSKKNDLIFLDKGFPGHYLQLEIVQDISSHNLVVRSLTRTPFFFVNGKKISGVLKIRPQDVISFGDNQIRILHFQKSRAEDDLGAAYGNFENNAPELRFALDFIEEVLIEMEQKGSNV